MKREIWLDPVRRSKRHLSMVFGIDDLRFETAYWYNDVDFYALEAQFGLAYMEKVYFHLLMFEANKLWSLKPATIDLGVYQGLHSAEFEQFWRTISHKAWTEWRYDQNLPDYQGPTFTSTPVETSTRPIAVQAGNVDTLNFCGGGKDSLVSMKLLERIEQPYANVVYSHSIYGTSQFQHDLIDGLIAHSANETRHQITVFDSFVDSPVLQLNPEYDVDTLKAAETPSTTFAALPIMLQHGYRYMVRGHEHSANVGNLIWDATGEDVNHQWGKSLEAEQLINDYLQQELIANLHYFSILQPIYDLLIFNLLRRDLDAVANTHSCNYGKPWCCKCAKCAYVWLNYMAYLPPENVNAIFNRNLFDMEENQLWYYQMLGLGEHTPFDCIGQIDESRLAFELCRRKGLTGRAMTMYDAHFPTLDIEPILDKYLCVNEQPVTLPAAFAAPTLAQMRAAQVEALRYITNLTG
ncbi:MAG: hypothetical protein ACPG8W_06175 [Candidatus Promineifilaceae bacterium]